MREIVFDTETTGLDWQSGHRVIEIGAVETFNRVPTGNTFHVYINPEREIEQDAINVHGITNEYVADKPKFAEIADDFLAFIAESPLVAHNATFDMGFLNYEMSLLNREPLANEVIDTLVMTRKKFPGARATLDALCQRYEIDTSARTYHGALLDAELLAAVYLELTGGRQPDLMGVLGGAGGQGGAEEVFRQTVVRPPRNFAASTEEVAEHEAFWRKKMKEGSLWYPLQEAAE